MNHLTYVKNSQIKELSVLHKKFKINTMVLAQDQYGWLNHVFENGKIQYWYHHKLKISRALAYQIPFDRKHEPRYEESTRRLYI